MTLLLTPYCGALRFSPMCFVAAPHSNTALCCNAAYRTKKTNTEHTKYDATESTESTESTEMAQRTQRNAATRKNANSVVKKAIRKPHFGRLSTPQKAQGTTCVYLREQHSGKHLNNAVRLLQRGAENAAGAETEAR